MPEKPDNLREVIEREMLNLDILFTASGHKSSEGDGRTAADIEEELKKNGP